MNHLDLAGVHVRSSGCGPTVLCCGGLGSTVDAWHPLWSELGDHYCVGFDPPGIGGSTRRPNGSSIGYLADLAGRIADDLDGPVTVVGYSFGGAVAQELVKRRPDLVSALVLVATSVGLGSIPGFGPALLGASWPHRWPIWNPATLGQVASFVGWSSLPWLARVDCPAWVVVGSADLVVPAANGWLLAAGLPDARLRVLPFDHDQMVTSAAPRLAGVIREAAAHNVQMK